MKKSHINTRDTKHPLKKIVKSPPYKLVRQNQANRIATLLLKHANNKHVTKNKRLLSRAIETFHDTPGFNIVLNRSLAGTDRNAQGYVYEIKKALQLHKQHHTEKPGTGIISFSRHIAPAIPPRDLDREFDLIVQDNDGNELWVECKDCDLNNGKKLKKEQFLDQIKIIRSYQEMGTPVSFIVSSNKPVPTEWHKWFTQHGINYEIEAEGISTPVVQPIKSNNEEAIGNAGTPLWAPSIINPLKFIASFFAA